MRSPTFVPTVPEREAMGTGTDFRRDAWTALKFFLPLLRGYANLIGLVCFFDLIGIILAFLPPVFGGLLIDQAFSRRSWPVALQLSLLLFATQAAIQGLLIYRNFLAMVLERRLVGDLRLRMYRKLQSLSIGFAESGPVGQRIFRLRIDADAVAVLLASYYPTLTRFIEFALVLTAVTLLDWQITLMVLGFLIPWTILQFWITTVYRVWDRKRLLAAELRDASVLQGVSSFALIKAFGRVRRELKRHAHRSIVTQRLANQNYQTWWVYDMAVLRLIPYLRNVVIAVYFGRRVILGDMTLGATVPATAFLIRLNDPIQKVVDFVNLVRKSVVPMERCMQLLQIQTSVPILDHPRDLPKVQGHISFQDVDYSHPSGPPILQGFNLELRPGTRTALVGPSGAGKSTVAALAVRLYDPTGGSVRVDGVDWRELNPNRVLQHFAIVTQETFIFSGSLADNLRYGKGEATDEDLRQVLADVDLAEWFERLPDGLAQDLESGHALSVGQKQRIGIARALLSRPTVVILDEPTSALDTETETAITETIWRLTEGMTVLLVTHRLNTAMRCDIVAVLADGVVAESASPIELAQSNGPFADLLRAFNQSATSPTS